MPVIEVDTHIDRPPQEVFDYLARFENLAVYDAFVTASGQVGDGPVGLGTRGWGKTRFMGQQFAWTVEYTEFDWNDQAWTGENTVRYLEAARVAGSAAGVAFISSLTINGAAADFVLPGVAPLPASPTDLLDPSTCTGTVT